LTLLGAELIGYSLDPYTELDNFTLSKIGEKITDIRADIRDKDKLLEVYKKYEPDYIFHLAAQPLVRESYASPYYTYEVNVMGTLGLMEAIRSDERKVTSIMITTDKCYENKEWIWGYRESDPMGGHDPYSSSKGCAELAIASYRNSFFDANINKAIASVRAGNVIGGGDWAVNRIIPDCIKALEENIPIFVRSPNAIRPWQHVLEPLGGYLLLGALLNGDKSKYEGAWNFGPNQSSIVNVEKVVQKLIKEWKTGAYECAEKKDNQLHEANLLNLDISKATHLLNWTPKWDIDKTIEKTAEWYKKYKSEDVYNLCVRQIKEYSSL
jgi:CDP-glucose 4,6-dehydratase